ncbi:MAG: plasmid mobilization protein [Eubacteriales bacterium]
MKTEYVKLRVTPEMKSKIKEAADAQNRSISNYVEMLILRDIAENCKKND